MHRGMSELYAFYNKKVSDVRELQASSLRYSLCEGFVVVELFHLTNGVA